MDRLRVPRLTSRRVNRADELIEFMSKDEIMLHGLIESHAASYGYSIVSFEFLELESYYKVRLDRFDKTHPITLRFFRDQLIKSVKANRLSPAIANRFRSEIGGMNERLSA